MVIKKGDTVQLLKGKDKGKSGKVIKVHRDKGGFTIEGINLFKKHVRPRRQGEKGETVEVPRPVSASNIALWCPNCGRGVRVGLRRDGKTKIRYCKKCGNEV